MKMPLTRAHKCCTPSPGDHSGRLRCHVGSQHLWQLVVLETALQELLLCQTSVIVLVHPETIKSSIFAKVRTYWLQLLKDERAGNVWMFDNWLQNTINVSNNYNHFGSFNVRLTRTQYDWRFIYSSNESKFVWLIVQRNVNDGILIKKNQALQPNGQVCNLIAKICQTNISFYEPVQLRPLIRIALQH